MNPRVYIIKEQVARGESGPVVVDYTPALEWGDIEFITDHDMPLYPRSSLQATWNKRVRQFVAEYDPECDYIVTTGQPIAMFTVGWALGRAGKAPRFLVWRREENRYRPVHFDAEMPTNHRE